MMNSIIHKTDLFFLSIALGCLPALSSCTLFEPTNDNHGTFERVLNTPSQAEGLLAWAYSRIPTYASYSYSLNEAATDNAVINDKTNGYLRMATGQWASSFNPVEQWNNCLAGIQSVNQFLSIVDSVRWKPSVPQMNELYMRRFKGEAYGMRALLKFHLLQSVAGEDNSGRLLGIPIMDEFLEQDADFNIPREGFSESVNSIYGDIDRALAFLTMDDYKDVASAADLPAGFENFPVADYNAIFGSQASQRISGRILKALRAKTALLEASPAFGNDLSLWIYTAQCAGALLNDIGGVGGLDPVGHRFYERQFVDMVNLAAGVDQREMIWRTRKTQSLTRETANFPPSLFGNGRINPTQNLVDAFPMQNGYPITDEINSGYDADNPYTGRDPRLDRYILHDNSPYKNGIIRTRVGGGQDAKDSISTSTRTGYYLKKGLVEDVNLNPAGQAPQNHYEVHIRYTEIFLIYAEAANEAWGPDTDGAGFGFTARDVIRAIRNRAEISQPDDYLNSLLKKEEMRQMIRNERRLELAFEGFRFWDLRRWKENLNETARGVEINSAGQYNYVDVEPRLYLDYMYAGPVPYQETVKYGNLVQNKGY
jgi:hypothetical protein